MRVTIKTRQEDGLLPSKKLYVTDCTVLFSEQEKAIIQARGTAAIFQNQPLSGSRPEFSRFPIVSPTLRVPGSGTHPISEYPFPAESPDPS